MAKVECGICKKQYDEEDIDGMIEHFMEQHQSEINEELRALIPDWFELGEDEES